VQQFWAGKKQLKQQQEDEKQQQHKHQVASVKTENLSHPIWGVRASPYNGQVYSPGYVIFVREIIKDQQSEKSK